MSDPATQDKSSSAPNPLGELIDDEVTREENRRQDFRTRSVSLLSVSSGILAIATGLLAVADKAESSTFVLSAGDKVVVIAAVASLVLSACFALWVNASAHDYVVSKTATLTEYVQAMWNEQDLGRFVANRDIDYLGRLRVSNERKKWILDFSIAFQVVGVALIATTALIILTSAS
jgi:hypothetical protein